MTWTSRGGGGDVMESWLILTLTLVVVACAGLIGCCACCVVRRFAPENERGPAWWVNLLVVRAF